MLSFPRTTALCRGRSRIIREQYMHSIATSEYEVITTSKESLFWRRNASECFAFQHGAVGRIGTRSPVSRHWHRHTLGCRRQGRRQRPLAPLDKGGGVDSREVVVDRVDTLVMSLE